LARRITLASMRPPLPLGLYRPADKPVDLDGKRILLTGASSGIGESAAGEFARHGATVVAVARRKDLLDSVVGRITEGGGTAIAIPCDLSDMDAVDALVADVEERLGGVDILINNAGRSIRRPLAESLERWHDVDRTMVFSEASPLFSVYNASKAALSAVSRVIETEWATKGVHSTTLYYPLVATPMIAPTKEYQGLPALTPHEAAGWMITAARSRPVRIAPRMAVVARALDTIGPGVTTTLIRRQRLQPGR
jgi:NAD(P)-dependent dehydrogenase (short-subunit alcohol dehydrogenase family)